MLKFRPENDEKMIQTIIENHIYVFNFRNKMRTCIFLIFIDFPCVFNGFYDFDDSNFVVFGLMFRFVF